VTVAEGRGWAPASGFGPSELTVSVRSWVTWSNAGAATHHVVATNGAFDSADLEPGEGFSWYADQPGTIAYACARHAWMHGQLHVVN
jgi:plastocyanin